MNASISNLSLVIRLLIDILVVWALIYWALHVLRNNARTIQIFKGILIIIVVKVIAVWLGLTTFSYIMDIFLQWGVLAFIILFQPEIRGLLEKLGKASPVTQASLTQEQTDEMIDQIVQAVAAMSKTKTGALITLQQAQDLSDYIQTGIRMDSVVSSELLGTIFQYGTPMHDGGVIIQGNKIACAAAYYPPTIRDLPTRYGARHRAAVGISEISDSITIIVSEETGQISVAVNGQLTQYPPEGLQRYLRNVLTTLDDLKQQDNPFIRTARTWTKSFNRKNVVVQEDDRIDPLYVVDYHKGGHKDA